MGILSFLPFNKTAQWILIGIVVAGIAYKFWSMSSTIDDLHAEIAQLKQEHKIEVIELQKEVAASNLVAESERANVLALEKGISEANVLVSKLSKEKEQVVKDFEKYKKTKPLVVEKIVTQINTTATASCLDYKNYNIELSKLTYKDLK